MVEGLLLSSLVLVESVAPRSKVLEWEVVEVLITSASLVVTSGCLLLIVVVEDAEVSANLVLMP